MMDDTPSSSQTGVCENIQPQEMEQLPTPLHIESEPDIAVTDVAQEDVESKISGDTSDETLVHVRTQLDADMANFIGSELTAEQKKLIVTLGPCQPSGPFM